MNKFIHYDTVGSFLRPKELKDARVKYFKKHSITKENYLKILHQAINNVVKKQKDIGLKIVTDGEFSRHDFMRDTITSFSGISVAKDKIKHVHFHGRDYLNHPVELTGPISFDSKNSKDLKDFKYLYQVAKQYDIKPRLSVSGPANTFWFLVNQPGNLKALKRIYPDINNFIHDIGTAYHKFFLTLYKVGCRDLKLDDPGVTGLDDSKLWPSITGGLFNRTQSKEVLLKLTNLALKDLPSDLALSTHLCRGNFASHWMFSGGYNYIADTFFAKENVDSFFLEYDDKRSGNFEPLKYIPKGKKVVLGLVTSKQPKLESQSTLIKRIKEASQYVPLKDLALSPQCGFASTEEGNHVTEAQQWAKIKLVIDTAKKVWG